MAARGRDGDRSGIGTRGSLRAGSARPRGAARPLRMVERGPRLRHRAHPDPGRCAMTSYRLGINTCFAVKRWPRPEEWARIPADELGLDLVQHSLDLVDLDAGEAAVAAQAADVRGACGAAGLELSSTFTGLIAYTTSLLLHPDPAARRRAVDWYERVIAFSALAGARRA